MRQTSMCHIECLSFSETVVRERIWRCLRGTRNWMNSPNGFCLQLNSVHTTTNTSIFYIYSCICMGCRPITSGRPEYRNKQNGDAFNVVIINEAIQEPDANTNIGECVRVCVFDHFSSLNIQRHDVDAARRRKCSISSIEIEIFPYKISSLGALYR